MELSSNSPMQSWINTPLLKRDKSKSGGTPYISHDSFQTAFVTIATRRRKLQSLGSLRRRQLEIAVQSAPPETKNLSFEPMAQSEGGRLAAYAFELLVIRSAERKRDMPLGGQALERVRS